MHAATRILLVCASLLYPLLWYYGREQGWFLWLAGAMLVLWLLRAAVQQHRGQQTVSLLIAAFFAAVLLFRQPESMYWYPVCVNALMLALFGGSLLTGQSLIERLARIQNPRLPPQAVAYTRRVTWIWCVFFTLNGSMAALLAALGHYRWWALYTGVVSYILMGLLGGGEWLLRQQMLKKISAS